MATVLVERRGEVALVLLNRPEAMNAVNPELRAALVGTLGELNRDAATKAVVIAGAGSRAFCAGQDLEESAALRLEDVEGWLERQHAMYQSVRDLEKPCVAAYNGATAGAGFQIGLCADLRVGYPEMKIGQPELKAGLASIVGSYLMTHFVSLTHNLQLSLAGELVDGTRAYEIGLLSHLVPRGEVVDKALALAAQMAQLPPTAMRMTKARFRETTQPGFDAALVAAKKAQKACFAAGEPQAATKKFFAERAARKKG